MTWTNEPDEQNPVSPVAGPSTPPPQPAQNSDHLQEAASAAPPPESSKKDRQEQLLRRKRLIEEENLPVPPEKIPERPRRRKSLLPYIILGGIVLCMGLRGCEELFFSWFQESREPGSTADLIPYTDAAGGFHFELPSGYQPKPSTFELNGLSGIGVEATGPGMIKSFALIKIVSYARQFPPNTSNDQILKNAIEMLANRYQGTVADRLNVKRPRGIAMHAIQLVKFNGSPVTVFLDAYLNGDDLYVLFVQRPQHNQHEPRLGVRFFESFKLLKPRPMRIAAPTPAQPAQSVPLVQPTDPAPQSPPASASTPAK